MKGWLLVFGIFGIGFGTLELFFALIQFIANESLGIYGLIVGGTLAAWGVISIIDSRPVKE